MDGILADTDVFVDHLRGTRRLAADRIHFSSITRAELFAGPEDQIDAVRVLLGSLTELGVDAGVAELGGAIKRATSIALPDALIAATALSADLEVLTGNARHFERVDGLRVRTPS